MSDLFDLAMNIGQRLLGRGVDVETAMEAMETIRAFAKAEEAKVKEVRAAKRAQDARNAKAYRERKKGASASIILTETDDLPSFPPHTPPYNPSNQTQTNACGTRLPEKWEPTPEDIQAVTADGLPEEILPTVLKDFRDHFLAEAGLSGISLNWSAKYRKFCRVRVEMIAEGRASPSLKPKKRLTQGGGRKADPAPVQAVFVVKGTPAWEAHLQASGRKPLSTQMHQGEEGRWFPTEWPRSEEAAA